MRLRKREWLSVGHPDRRRRRSRCAQVCDQEAANSSGNCPLVRVEKGAGTNTGQQAPPNIWLTSLYMYISISRVIV
jgi:hypothetical protein